MLMLGYRSLWCSARSLEAQRLREFWTDLRAVLDAGPPESKLHDVVLLSCTVADLTPPLQTKPPEAEVRTAWLLRLALI